MMFLGILVESVLEGMAEYYSLQLSTNIRRGQLESAKKLQCVGGTRPLGYDVDRETKRYIRDEKTAPIVKQIFDRYAEGQTEKEIAFEIEKHMLLNGAEDIAFDLIVAFGENSSMPHAIPTDRKLRKGDIIQFDIGCKYEGYCSDFSRVVFTEEPTEEQKNIYNFLIDEQKRLSSAF